MVAVHGLTSWHLYPYAQVHTDCMGLYPIGKMQFDIFDIPFMRTTLRSKLKYLGSKMVNAEINTDK